jgi:hypothetical protein
MATVGEGRGEAVEIAEVGDIIDASDGDWNWV